jgi:hypothetical protein
LSPPQSRAVVSSDPPTARAVRRVTFPAARAVRRIAHHSPQVYNNLQLHRGVFSVDQNLYRDGSTRWMVDQLAKVLVKLSEVNVLTSVQGEIRKVLMQQV